MKAIILAAGRGSRMQSLTKNAPKCLLTVGQQTLLARQLDLFAKLGLEVGVVSGYRRRSLQLEGCKEFKNRSWRTTNMVHSLTLADSWLGSDDCIVSYSDIYFETSGLQPLLGSEENISMCYDVNWESLWRARFADPLSDAESFKVDSTGWVTEIGSRPSDILSVQGQFMGLLKIRPAGWQQLRSTLKSFPPEARRNLQLTHLLGKAIALGDCKVCGIPYADKWMEFDSPSDLRLFNDF